MKGFSFTFIIISFFALLAITASATAQLAEQPWPMYQHDARHTGQSQFVGPQIPAIKWKFHPDMDFTTKPLIDKDGTIYAGIYGGTLCAINLDKTVKWRFKIDGDIKTLPVVTNDTIYFGSDPYLYALNKDGSLRWSYYLQMYEGYSNFTGKEGEIYLFNEIQGAMYGEFITGIHALTPEGILKWTFKIDGRMEGIPFYNFVIGSDGSIMGLFSIRSGPYAGKDCIYTLNPDGSEKCVKFLGEGGITRIIVKNDTVYYSTQFQYDQNFYLNAMNLDCSTKWETKLDGEIQNYPVFSKDGSIYIFVKDTSRVSNIIAFDSDGTKKWHYQLGDVLSNILVVGEDGTIYSYSRDKDSHPYKHYLVALNPDGTLKWKFQSEYEINDGSVIANDGKIYFCNSTYLYALNSEGEQIWRYSLGYFPGTTTFLSADGSIYALTQYYMIKVDPDGKELWRMRCYGSSFGAPSIGSDGTIYATSGELMLSVNPDGTEKGSGQVLDLYDPISPAIDYYGDVYIGGAYDFYALNNDLSSKWTIALRTNEENIRTSTTIVNNQIYFCTTSGYLFYASTDGELHWETKLGYENSAPSISDDGNIFVISTNQKEMLNSLHGSWLNWSYPISNLSYNMTPVIGSDGTIYVPSVEGQEEPYDYYLCAINPDGTTKWKIPTESYLGDTPAIGPDDTIYFSVYEKLYAVNLDGSLKWTFALDEVYNMAISPIIDAQGTIYVPSTLGRYLNAINPDGSLKWKMTLDAATSLAMGADGTIYIGSKDEYLCAIGEADKPAVDIYSNNSSFIQGNVANINVNASNPYDKPVDMYVVLMFNGGLYWYPVWDNVSHSTEIAKGVWDKSILSLNITEDIPKGSYTFYAALTTKGTMNLIDLDMVTIVIN
jgi:hypothetical protein